MSFIFQLLLEAWKWVSQASVHRQERSCQAPRDVPFLLLDPGLNGAGGGGGGGKRLPE